MLRRESASLGQVDTRSLVTIRPCPCCREERKESPATFAGTQLGCTPILMREKPLGMRYCSSTDALDRLRRSTGIHGTPDYHELVFPEYQKIDECWSHEGKLEAFVGGERKRPWQNLWGSKSV